MRGGRRRRDTPGMTADPVSIAVASPARSLPERYAATGCAWAGRLSHVLAGEIRAAVVAGTITTAEGEQLFARLVLVIDQATSTPRW